MTSQFASGNLLFMCRIGLPLIVLAAFFLACNSSESGSSSGGESQSEATKAPEKALERSRPRRLRPPPPFNKTPPPVLMSASEVLIGYKGANHSKAARTKEDALEKAREILARAQKGEPLHRLAVRFSDSPSSKAGGFMGTFEPKTRSTELADAIQSVGFDELVPEIIESQFGYHVVRREKVVHIGHVLVMHKEAMYAHNEITRTREEAEAEAERLRKALSSESADRAKIATKSSDCRRSKLVGGDLGYYGKGGRGHRGGRLMPELVGAVSRLDPGEVSKVVSSDYGFHVAWRFPDPEPTKAQSKAPAAGAESQKAEPGPASDEGSK